MTILSGKQFILFNNRNTGAKRLPVEKLISETITENSKACTKQISISKTEPSGQTVIESRHSFQNPDQVRKHSRKKAKLLSKSFHSADGLKTHVSTSEARLAIGGNLGLRTEGTPQHVHHDSSYGEMQK